VAGTIYKARDGLKLNGTHQLMAYADDVNILGGSVHTVRENAEALVVATKEFGLKVNTDKLNTWLCLGIGMQGGVTALRFIIGPLKGWKSSNIWERN
jgi:hypothetical protein